MSRRAAVRFAWRDLRGSPARTLSMVVMLACAVASVHSISATNAALRQHLAGGARQWLGGDLQVSFRDLPEPEAAHALDGEGGTGTVVLQTLTMIRVLGTGAQSPAALKAVEPGEYPLYGWLGLRPAMGVAQALAGDGLAVNPELLRELGAGIGAQVEINGRRFTIRAEIQREADRWASMPNAFHHIILSRQSLEDSGVLRRGNGVSCQVVYRLKAGASIERCRKQLEELFPYAGIADYRQPDEATSQALDRGAEFLALAAWLSLAAAFVAGGLLLHLHLEDRLDSFAALKALGATPGALVWMAAAQALGLMAVSLAVGAVTGTAAARLALRAAGAVLSLELAAPSVWSDMGLSAASCAAGGLLIFVRTLAAAAPVSPMRLLRRHVDAPAPGWAQWRRGTQQGGIFVALVVGAALPTALLAMYAGVAPGLARALPAAEANLILVSPSGPQMEEVRRWLPASAELAVEARLVWLRLSAISGRAGRGGRMWFALCRQAGSVAPGTAVVSAARARELGAGVGDRLEFALPRRKLQVRITQVVEQESLIGSSVGLEMACEDLADVPRFVHAGLRVAPERLSALRQELAREFPTVVQISRQELDQLTRGALRQGLGLVRAGMLSAAAGCVLIVALMAAAAGRRQMRETAILRALGASRRALLRRALAAYFLLGAGAGLCGGLAGVWLAAVVVRRMLHSQDAPVAWAALGWAAPSTAVVALAAGWLATSQALRRRPMETLREL